MFIDTQPFMDALSTCSPSQSPQLLVAVMSTAIALSLVVNHLLRSGRAAHATVRDLFVYPIKGCAGVRVATATVTRRGLAHDRMLMVVRASDGAFQTQRQHPRMATIRPLWNEAGDLVLTAPSRPDFVLLDADSKRAARRAARVWGHVVPDAVDWGDAVADWLCDTLSVAGLRLVRMPDAHARAVRSADCDGVVSFADGFPVLLASDRSRRDVCERAGLSALSMARFRPNVVVDGPRLRAFEEHRWRRVVLGNVGFEAPVECKRCQVPRIDPASGTPDSLPDNQPTAALNALTKNHFGVNLVPVVSDADGSDFSISVGDRVRVVKRAGPE